MPAVHQISKLTGVANLLSESPLLGNLIKMTIANNGNIGIGVTRPELKLHVYGTTYLQNAIGSSLLKVDNLNNAFADTPDADIDLRVDTMRMLDASGAGTVISSGGYRRLFVQTYGAGGSGSINAYAPPIKSYDRFIVVNTYSASSQDCVVEIGLNNFYSVTGGAAPYLRLGLGHYYGGCSALIPAGVQCYISVSKPIPATVGIGVYELKFGRNENPFAGV